MTREEYFRLKSKAYVLSEKRFEQMEDNGWCYISLHQVMSEQFINENVEKLSRYSKVKIYEATTCVKGLHSYFAMVK